MVHWGEGIGKIRAVSLITELVWETRDQVLLGRRDISGVDMLTEAIDKRSSQVQDSSIYEGKDMEMIPVVGLNVMKVDTLVG
ncbi:hypothetical protein QYF36_007471 [Acer negundo]|nr:hypothetical protein QYF36_007471 [Acer negundo]